MVYMELSIRMVYKIVWSIWSIFWRENVIECYYKFLMPLFIRNLSEEQRWKLLVIFDFFGVKTEPEISELVILAI